jgi:hypothetical protein
MRVALRMIKQRTLSRQYWVTPKIHGPIFFSATVEHIENQNSYSSAALSTPHADSLKRQVGPFYCPADEKVYLDTSFFQELRNRFQSPGDFAQAYVIAHEIGHHVQNLLGTTDRVERNRSNQNSVRSRTTGRLLCRHLCKSQSQRLDAGDIDEALGAATMIGDDRLQMRSRGYVVPESFTHGSSNSDRIGLKQASRAGTSRPATRLTPAHPRPAALAISAAADRNRGATVQAALTAKAASGQVDCLRRDRVDSVVSFAIAIGAHFDYTPGNDNI